MKKRDLKTFLILIIVTMIIFIPFLKAHYATDTYYIINKGYKNYLVNNSLKDGRLLMAGIGFLADICNISANDVYVISLTILALITSCISVIILKNTILGYKNTNNIKQEIIITIISYFTIFNFMYIENMIFVECLVMSLSILFYMLSAKAIVNKGKSYIPKALIFAILGVLSYQGTVSMYLTSLLVFSILKNEEIKKIFKDLCIGAFIILIGIIIQLLSIKLFENIFNITQTRISKNILANALIIRRYLFELIVNTGYVFPKYLYIIFLSIIELSILMKATTEHVKDRILYEQIIILLFGIAFGLSTSLVSSSGFWSARIRYSIGAIIGFLFLYLYVRTNLLEEKKKINCILIATFLIYGIINIINYENIMNNTIAVNNKDKEMTLEIYNYVIEQEKLTNTKINKLVLVRGNSTSKAFYEDLKFQGSVLSWSAIRTFWAIEGLLEMYTDKDFEEVEATNSEIQYYLQNVDKEKEYLCIDDTLYVSYYIE